MLIYNRKNMQVRFTMILPSQGYNSLSYPFLLYEVWRTNVSKYKPIRIGEPNQLIQLAATKPLHFFLNCVKVVFMTGKVRKSI